MGIKVKKEWMSTHDLRTRLSHRKIDGERVDPSEKFSNGLLHPGDPNGEACEVWNCRCTMVSYLDGTGGQERETYEEWLKREHPELVDIDSFIKRGSGFDDGEKAAEKNHFFLGKIDLSDNERVEEIKDNFVDRFASSPVENMFVITKDGEVHFLTSGNTNFVDCSVLADKLDGSYNIHTHPKDYTQYSFSDDEDFGSFFADGTSVMEACDFKYRYRVERNYDVTFEEWDRARYEVQQELLTQPYSYGLTEDNYEEMIQHILIQETCKRVGMIYKRWKR